MKTIAILGASSQRAKFGNKAVRAYLSAGWTVYPINPAGGEVEGLPALRSLAELTAPPERVSVYLPPPVSLALLPEIAAARPAQVWFNPGSADGAVLARARELGLNAIDACSIVDIGLSPSQFP